MDVLCHEWVFSAMYVMLYVQCMMSSAFHVCDVPFAVNMMPSVVLSYLSELPFMAGLYVSDTGTGRNMFGWLYSSCTYVDYNKTTLHYMVSEAGFVEIDWVHLRLRIPSACEDASFW